MRSILMVAALAHCALMSTSVEGRLARGGPEINVRSAQGIILHAIAALPKEGFVVVWSEPLENPEPSRSGAVVQGIILEERRVLASWYGAGGELLIGPQVVSVSSAGRSPGADIAVLENGYALIVWRSWEARRVLGRFFDGAGNATGKEFQVNEGLTRFNGHVAASNRGDGTVLVLWNDLNTDLPFARDLLFGRSVSPGGPLGETFTVDDDEEGGAHQLHPDAVLLTEGAQLITWYDSDVFTHFTIRGKVLAEESDSEETSFQVAVAGSYQHKSESCAREENGFAVVWEGVSTVEVYDRGLWARRFDGEQNPLGESMKVLGQTDSTGGDRQRMGGVVCGVDGDITATVVGIGNLAGRSLQDGSFTTSFHIENVPDTLVAAFSTKLNKESFVQTWTECLVFDRTMPFDCELFAQVLTSGESRLCAGDCDGDGEVTVGELVRSTGISLSGDRIEVRKCVASDISVDYQIRINELITAVSNSLEGCR